MENIFWAAYTHKHRNDIIGELEAVIAQHGSITDFKFFSDVAVTLKIELEEKKLAALYDDLKHHISIDNYEPTGSVSEAERIVFLNINFTGQMGEFLT